MAAGGYDPNMVLAHSGGAMIIADGMVVGHIEG